MQELEKGIITRNLVISFCILIVIFISYGLVTLYDIRTISGLTQTIYNHPLVVSNSAHQANTSITKMHRNMKDVVLFKSVDRIQKAVAAVNQEEKQVYQYLDVVRDRILGDEGKNIEKEARNLFKEWEPIRREVIGLVHDGQREKAAEITTGKGADYVIVLEAKMIALTDYAREKAASFMVAADTTRSRLNITTIIFLLCGLIAASFVALFTLNRTASSEKKIHASEKRYRMLIESQVDLVSRFTPDGKFNFVNDVFCDFFNKSKEDLIGSNWQPLPVVDDRENIEGKLSSLSSHNPTEIIENRVYSGKGDIHWLQFINKGFFDSDGKLLEIQSVGRDITERKEADKALKESLREKEVLLKEIHHRVKNNMQIIQSLISIQTDKISDVELRKPLIESNNRIKSMALIHETLYHSKDIAKLDIDAYFKNISNHLFKIYRNSSHHISLSVSVDPIALDMDQCIACGLIINELISNALKYAFVDMTDGELGISLKQINEENATLCIDDNGKGFPDSIDHNLIDSMGLRIVRILVKGQLKGNMSIKNRDGTAFNIIFPLPSVKKQVIS